MVEMLEVDGIHSASFQRPYSDDNITNTEESEHVRFVWATLHTVAVLTASETEDQWRIFRNKMVTFGVPVPTFVASV